MIITAVAEKIHFITLIKGVAESMNFKNLVGRKFGDLTKVEKSAVLSSLIFDGSMWGMVKLDNGSYDVTADIAGTDVAIMAVLTVGIEEDVISIDNNEIFYNCVEGQEA